MKAFWSGFPGPCGGANTECYHTAKMLREGGVDLTFIPTGGHDNSFREKLEAIGCQVADAKWGEMAGIEGLAGSVVISMCNSHFSNHGDEFRNMGCATVWVNCMTFLAAEELRHYRRYKEPYDAYVFQSNWQREKLEPQLRSHGYTPDRGHLIRGAFALDEFPFVPKATNGVAVVGRLARAAEDKWSSNTWAIYTQTRELAGRMQARLMGVDDKIKHKLGKAPDWGQMLPQCHESTQDFLGSLDVMLSVNGGAGENWPRIGLEAMAAGVPLVVQDSWGWQEMIEHAQTGFLAKSDEQLATYASLLCLNPTLRRDIVERARSAVEKFADHATIFGQWESMLQGLGA